MDRRAAAADGVLQAAVMALRQVAGTVLHLLRPRPPGAVMELLPEAVMEVPRAAEKPAASASCLPERR